MAQRYGGRYSRTSAQADRTPQPAPRASARTPLRVDPVGARSNVLFLPPVVLAFTSLGAGAAGFAVGLLGAAALLLGAWLLRDGLRAEAAFAERSIARRPALPRKILAAALCGTGTALAAWTSEPGFIAPVLLGLAGTALHLGAFGLDPLRDKGIDGDTVQNRRVARVLDDAELYLNELTAAGRASGDREVEARIDGLAASVREMIRSVERDPRDLTAARRYLGVYLMGARDAARKFAELHMRTGGAGARADFLRLLGDLEAGFDQKTRVLLLDDATDLEVEIDVLRDRLKREGVQLES